MDARQPLLSGASPRASSSSDVPPRPRDRTMPPLSRLKSAIWGPPSIERSLLIKLDSTVLIYFSLIWFLFGINRASYSTAYISGMKDIGFEGKDYNYMTTIYLVCYAVMQVPSTSVLTIVRPKYVFVLANTVWSVLTLVTFRVERVWQVFVLNGFEGAFSAIAYVGAHFVYGSWYTQAELGKRAAVFCGFGNLGNMAGGWIQAALLASLSDKGGLPPWRWMFIVVSLMTIPFALFGWFAIPDLPHHRAANFLTEEEKDFAIRRLGDSRKQSWDVTVFRRVLLSWQFWLLPTVFMLYSLCVQSLSNNVMQFWMASRGYSVIQQNNYPTGIYAVGIVATFLYTTISDRIRSRWECSLAVGLTFVIGSAILVAHPAHDAGFFFAFYLLGSTYAPQALWYSWMADLTAQDVQLRAITTGFMNSFDFAFVSWWPIVFYPVTDAPRFEKGYVASLVTGALTIPFILTIAWLEKKGRSRGEIGRVFEEAQAETEPYPEDRRVSANGRKDDNQPRVEPVP